MESGKEEVRPVLGYYKLRGWAGPIRLLLAYLKVDHVEKLYPVPSEENGQGQWGHEKFTLGLDFPNGLDTLQIPYWIDSVVKLTETKAILKHISRLKDQTLLGDTVEQQAKVNMLEEVLWDMWLALTKICMEHTENLKLDFLNDAFQKLKLLENFLSDDDNLWAVGANVTYVDFLLYEILVHYKKFSGKLLEPFPKLRSFLLRFQSIPSIKKCIHSPQFVQGPCFGYKFKAKL